jgi:hypothetical protein
MLHITCSIGDKDTMALGSDADEQEIVDIITPRPEKKTCVLPLCDSHVHSG